MFEEKNPKILYGFHDPKYREKLLELENSLQFAAFNSRECQDLFVEFYNQFMMPKEFWDELFEETNFFDNSIMFTTVQTAIYQFYYRKSEITFNGMKINFPKRKLYNYVHPDFIDTDLEDLCLPDKALDVKLDNYEKYASSFIPKTILRTHEKMKALYSRIKSNEKNVDQWFEALIEVEDEEFVENNIEYRIGNDLTNKELWKLYIEYLKKKDDKQKLLQTYSKYCRFFLDDSEMLKEYKKAAKNQIVYVPWKNPFDFEIYDETYFKKLEENEIQSTQKSPLMFHFNAENASIQRFPFKPNFMNYILKNANAYILHNLFKTCKWFYLKNPVTICYKFDINQHFNNIEINEQRICLNPSVLNRTNITKLYISTCFDVFYLLNENELSRFIPIIYRCSAKYISIREQKLSNEELTILLGHGNVEELSFFQVKDDKNDYLIVENILKTVPKIKRFALNGVRCTSETSQKLCEFPFQNKLEWFSLTDIQNNLLEPKAFAEFIGICPSSESIECWIRFSNFHGREDFLESFKKIIDNVLYESWKIDKYESDGFKLSKKN